MALVITRIKRGHFIVKFVQSDIIALSRDKQVRLSALSILILKVEQQQLVLIALLIIILLKAHDGATYVQMDASADQRGDRFVFHRHLLQLLLQHPHLKSSRLLHRLHLKPLLL